MKANFTVQSSGIGFTPTAGAVSTIALLNALGPNELFYILVWAKAKWILCKWQGKETTTMQRLRLTGHAAAAKKALTALAGVQKIDRTLRCAVLCCVGTTPNGADTCSSLRLPVASDEFTTAHIPHITDAVFIGVTNGIQPPPPADEKKAAAAPEPESPKEPASPGGSRLRGEPASPGGGRFREPASPGGGRGLSPSSFGRSAPLMQRPGAAAAGGFTPMKRLKEDSKATLPGPLPPLIVTANAAANGALTPTTPTSAAAAAAAGTGIGSPLVVDTSAAVAPPPGSRPTASTPTRRHSHHHGMGHGGHGHHTPTPLTKFKGNSGLSLHDEDKLTNVIKLMAAPFSPVNWALMTYKTGTSVELKGTGADGAAGFEKELKSDNICYVIFVSSALGVMPKRIWFVYWIGPNVKVTTAHGGSFVVV